MFAGGRRAPSPALHVGLACSNSASTASGVLPGGHSLGAGGRPWPLRRRGLGRCGQSGMGGNAAGDSLRARNMFDNLPHSGCC
jgi:hypothetical protein